LTDLVIIKLLNMWITHACISNNCIQYAMKGIMDREIGQNV